MKKLILFILFAFLATSVFSQNDKIEFIAELQIDDLEMKMFKINYNSVVIKNDNNVRLKYNLSFPNGNYSSYSLDAGYYTTYYLEGYPSLYFKICTEGRECKEYNLPGGGRFKLEYNKNESRWDLYTY